MIRNRMMVGLLLAMLLLMIAFPTAAQDDTESIRATLTTAYDTYNTADSFVFTERADETLIIDIDTSVVAQVQITSYTYEATTTYIADDGSGFANVSTVGRLTQVDDQGVAIVEFELRAVNDSLYLNYTPVENVAFFEEDFTFGWVLLAENLSTEVPVGLIESADYFETLLGDGPLGDYVSGSVFNPNDRRSNTIAGSIENATAFTIDNDQAADGTLLTSYATQLTGAELNTFNPIDESPFADSIIAGSIFNVSFGLDDSGFIRASSVNQTINFEVEDLTLFGLPEDATGIVSYEFLADGRIEISDYNNPSLPVVDAPDVTETTARDTPTFFNNTFTSDSGIFSMQYPNGFAIISDQFEAENNQLLVALQANSGSPLLIIQVSPQTFISTSLSRDVEIIENLRFIAERYGDREMGGEYDLSFSDAIALSDLEYMSVTVSGMSEGVPTVVEIGVAFLPNGYFLTTILLLEDEGDPAAILPLRPAVHNIIRSMTFDLSNLPDFSADE